MKTILVALDNSERSGPVLDAAVKLARSQGGRLVLLRVVPHIAEIPYERFGPEMTTLTQLLLKESRTALDNLGADLGAGLVESTRVEAGTPWRIICDSAREVGADLVVIGAHGYGPLERVIGTTAQRVVNHADRSVLVVRGKP